MAAVEERVYWRRYRERRRVSISLEASELAALRDLAERTHVDISRLVMAGVRKMYDLKG